MRIFSVVLAASLLASSAFGQNPFLPESISWVAGAPGGSTPGGGLDFPGVNGQAAFLDIPGLIRDEETDYSVSLWFNTDQVGRESFFLGTRNQGIHHGLREPDGGGGTHNALHSAHWGADVRGTTALEPGTWYHAVFTHDAANDMSDMFINGVSERGPFAQREPNQNAGNILWGARNNGDAAWDGKLDDMAVWNTIITQADIDALAAGGSPTNASVAPVGYWGLEEGTGTTAADGAGNGLDGSFINPAINSPSVPAAAAVDTAGLTLADGVMTRWWKTGTGNQLANARGVRDADPHHASYISMTVDSTPGDGNDYGAAEPIGTFADVQGSALSITQAGMDAGIDASTANQDSMWSYNGLIEIRAEDDVDPTAEGIQVAFGIPSDDATDLIIGGVTILENDGGHGFNGPNPGPQSVDFEAPGVYDISLLLTQGGGGVGIELLGSMSDGNPIHNLGLLTDAVPANRLTHVVPEPSSVVLFGIGILALARRRRK